MRYLLTLFVHLLLLISSTVRAGEPTRAAPPVEQEPTDAKAVKIVLIAGSNFFKPGEHEYVGGPPRCLLSSQGSEVFQRPPLLSFVGSDACPCC